MLLAKAIDVARILYSIDLAVERVAIDVGRNLLAYGRIR